MPQLFRNFAPAFLALALSSTALMAESLSGAYLSAKIAQQDGDYAAAAEYYGRALDLDPENLFLLRNSIFAELGTGRVDQAIERAKATPAQGQLSPLVRIADAFETGAYGDAIAILKSDDASLNPLLRGLLIGWAELGQGDMTAATAAFDALEEPEAFKLFGQYHKALALALVGDFESAEEIFQGDVRGPLVLNRGSIIARAQVLAQLDLPDEAVGVLQSAVRGDMDPQLQVVADMITAGDATFDFIQAPKEGAAEVFYTIASALQGEDDDRFAIVYSRLSEYLAPNFTDAKLLSAELLRASGQYDLASASFAKVPPEDPLFLDAEFGRADTLIDADKPDAAIEVLRGLSRTNPNNLRVQATLGDALRGQQDYALARDAYNAAVDLIEEADRSHWFTFYARGITNERVGDWALAEADFRRALELNPGQPLVLNYLGYSLVEMGIKIDEAQKMIEDAVAARPDDGYITDSLGWVLYRQGKFAEAIAPMERAIELVPDDPIINDHLGDVYWKVGRKREAQFQWRRSLSFEPEEEDAERTRLKLEIGLDAVLKQEEAMTPTESDEN